ncbi:helix-turn-helix transcriptional regulator [Pseudonocardia sp. TRM90224]|uniref:helix-turn-helix transcriptional regulator n=1 Tax=Pseudonocardia sp. TRM90224 TaxID=2812678 RepID=UPI0027E06E2E|nr:LuxR C-terminal-related transcriptional regulator [Pseudonocardia sp. TRM90224]
MPDGWPLTGRGDELRMVDALGRRRGAASGVVLAGAPGVGKTRLAKEALAVAAQRGALTRWAAASASARTLPLGAFAPVVASIGTDPTQLVRQAGEALLAGAGPAGVMLGVDDGHLLDELSALLVHQIVLRRAATVVVTLRTGEPTPDAVTALWKDGHLERLELQALTLDDSTALLEAALGGPVTGAAVRSLWTITRGNVLYLRHLVDGEREAGRLREVEGVWQWTGTPRLTSGLSELLQERIGALSPKERDVVELLAFGEPLGVAVLTGLTDGAAVEAVEARGLIEVTLDGRRLQARLGHPLYGEVQRASCGQVRARRLRGRIAEALAATGARRADDLLRRAVLTMESDRSFDPDLLTAGAHRAAALVDAPLASRLAGAAIAQGGGFEARLTLATVLVGVGQEARAELADLVANARTDRERAEAAILQVASLAWMSARPEAAAEVLDAADAEVEDPAARRTLAALRSCLDAAQGRVREAAGTASAVLAAPGIPDHVEAFASWGLTLALGAIGKADQLGPVVERGRAAAVRAADAAWLGVTLAGWHTYGVGLAGYVDEALTIARAAEEHFGDAPLPAAISSILAGFAETTHGRVRTARRRLKEAHASLAPFGIAGGWLAACLMQMPQVLATCGEREAAREALVALEATKHPGLTLLAPAMRVSEAWVLACEGGMSAAIETARCAAAEAASRGQSAVEVLALHTAVCFGDRTGAGRLAELATFVDGPRAPAAAAHAEALATSDATGLLAAAERLEAMGALLLAADAAAQAAAVYDHNGQRGSALAAATRAHRLAAECEGAVTPALRALDQPLPLTDREREVAALAATGLPNREIAERLTLSVRTVEGHLYRACHKLGVTDRGGLGELFR